MPAAAADQAAHLPPVSTLFAAFLGYNPIEHLIGAATLAHLPAAQQAALLGHGFFPSLIAAAFRAGLHAALDFAIVASLLAAAASWTRGGRYVHADLPGDSPAAADVLAPTDASPVPVVANGAAPAMAPTGADPADAGAPHEVRT